MYINKDHTPNLEVENNTAFISDIHLDPEHQARTDLFLEFLTRAKQHVSTLYILGDLFEYWVGDDDKSPFANSILNALMKFSEHNTLYFMRGNRDFIVGRRFAKRTGAIILNDPQVITLNGQSGLLMHGDLLCTLDKVYLKTRAFYTHPITKAILNLTPIGFREHKANQLRNRSKQHHGDVQEVIQDVHQPDVERTMQQYNATLLIHGHTHKPGTHQFNMNDLHCERHVLGDWYSSGNTLIYSNNQLNYQTFHKAESIQF